MLVEAVEITSILTYHLRASVSQSPAFDGILLRAKHFLNTVRFGNKS